MTLDLGLSDYVPEGPKRAPALGAPSDDIVAFCRRHTNRLQSLRNNRLSSMARNIHYYLGRQWIRENREILVGPNRGFAFIDIDDDRPRPVTNRIGVACDNEIARIGRREYEFRVIADSTSPKIEEAARLAQDVLRHSLKSEEWDEERDEGIRWLVIAGTVGMRSSWERSLLDLVYRGYPDAVNCSACGAILSSTTFPQEKRSILQSNSVLSGQTETEFSVSACPFCAGALLPYRDEENLADPKFSDAIGRPMGSWEPRGAPKLETVSPFWLYPQNSGMDCRPSRIRVMGYARPVHLDYLFEQFADEVEEMKPEEPSELLRLHPVLGDWHYSGAYDPSSDAELFDNHILLREVTVEPFIEKFTEETKGFMKEAGFAVPSIPADSYFANDGRRYLVAGNKVLHEGPLFVPYVDHEGKKRKVREVTLRSARYKYRLGEFWGVGLPDDMISPQNRINARDSQWIETVDSMGSPNLRVPDDMELNEVGWRVEGYAGKILSFSPSLANRDAQPEVMQGAAMPAGVWESERASCIADMRDLGNTQVTELGGIPPGVRTTSQLVVAGENAQARRVPVERGFIQMLEQVGKHRLHLLYALRTEQDSFEVDAFGGKAKSIRYFRGSELLRQINVELEKESGYSKSLYDREAAAEALQEGVYDIRDPVVRRKYLELRGLPELNERDNMQIESARHVAIAFADRLETHNPDPTVEDPWIFYQILGQAWLSDENLEKFKELVEWDSKIVPSIVEWQKDLEQAEAADALARANYGPIPPDEAQRLHTQALDQQQQVLQKVKEVSAQNEALGQGPVQMPMLPPPPPPPDFMPNSLKERIRLVMCKRLNWNPAPKSTSIGRELLAAAEAGEVMELGYQLLDFRCTLEAYRLYSERQKAAAMGGAMQLAAPGGSATQSGLVPAPTGEKIMRAPNTLGAPETNAGVQMPTGRLG